MEREAQSSQLSELSPVPSWPTSWIQLHEEPWGGPAELFSQATKWQKTTNYCYFKPLYVGVACYTAIDHGDTPQSLCVEWMSERLNECVKCLEKGSATESQRFGVTEVWSHPPQWGQAMSLPCWKPCSDSPLALELSPSAGLPCSLKVERSYETLYKPKWHQTKRQLP